MNATEDPTAKAMERKTSGATTRRQDPMRDLFNSPIVRDKFKEILGDEGNAFLANALQAVQRNPALMKCAPNSVITSCMIAASLKLSVDPALGEAYVVPYADKGVQVAQCQIGYKGFVQLAWRTGQYRDMNVVPVYEDEFKSEDIKTGRVIVEPLSDGWRSKARMGNADAEKHIKGYLAFFELMNGAYKEEFWYLNEIDAHGKRFSKSFNFSGGPWTTSRAAMRAKTVLKSLLSAWGPKSVTMAKSMTLDGASGTDMDLKTVVNDDISFSTEEPQAIEESAPSGPDVEAGTTSAEPVATQANKVQDKKPGDGEPGLGIY